MRYVSLGPCLYLYLAAREFRRKRRGWCNGIVTYASLGLPHGHVRCPVPCNHQPHIDIVTETSLCTEYLTTYVYTWFPSHSCATIYHTISLHCPAPAYAPLHRKCNQPGGIRNWQKIRGEDGTSCEGNGLRSNEHFDLCTIASDDAIVVDINRSGDKIIRVINIHDWWARETRERPTSRQDWEKIIRRGGGGGMVLTGDFNSHRQCSDPRCTERMEAT